jgi:hypothetical protein
MLYSGVAPRAGRASQAAAAGTAAVSRKSLRVMSNRMAFACCVRFLPDSNPRVLPSFPVRDSTVLEQTTLILPVYFVDRRANGQFLL